MGPFFKAEKDPDDDASFIRARSALEGFWGRSNGGHAAYAALEQTLRELELAQGTLRRLRLNLPVSETSGTTTAAKIARAARLLEIMEGE